jgi:hypothetical protein
MKTVPPFRSFITVCPLKRNGRRREEGTNGRRKGSREEEGFAKEEELAGTSFRNLNF